MNIGLLGFGSMGRTHAYAVANIPFFYSPAGFRARITAVCTAHPESAARAAADFGLGRAVCDEDELINDPSLDAVDICTPNNLHYETLKKCLAKKKHVLCEKPLCVTSAEAAEIARLASEAGVTAQITFNYRRIPPMLAAKRLADDGALGRILSFRACYRHNSCADPDKKAGWKQSREICGGGVLFDLGSHAIDLVRYICGEFKAVSGRAQIAFPERAGLDGKLWKTDADEAFYLTAELENGAVGTVEANKLALGENDGLTLEVYGTLGSIKFDLMEPNFLYHYDASANGGFDRSVMDAHSLGGTHGFKAVECVGRLPEPAGVFPGIKAPVGWLRSHVGNMYAFLSAAADGRPASPDFTEAARVQAVMQAAYESDAAGGVWRAVDYGGLYGL